MADTERSPETIDAAATAFLVDLEALPNAAEVRALFKRHAGNGYRHLGRWLVYGAGGKPAKASKKSA